MFFLLNKFAIFTNQKPALKTAAGQRSLTTVKTFCDHRKALSNGHHGRHYLDKATTFINFNPFANSSKTIFALI